MGELERAEGRSPWAYIQDWDVEAMGEQILDAEQRAPWALAFSLGGGLGYIWRELARPVCDIIYALLELRPGDQILIIGEAIKACGWAEDIRAIVGPDGRVDEVEIIREGRAAVRGGSRGRNGMIGNWEWTYTRESPDDAYDCVAVLQATQHCDDWAEMAAEVSRVMKPGRRFVSAEAVYGGTSFRERVNSDVHLRQWHDKMFERIKVDEVSYYSGQDLQTAFADRLVDSRVFEWRGIEMFWDAPPPDQYFQAPTP